MDTFFVRSMLVPSLVVLLGRWNWWPSKPSHGEPIKGTAGSQPGVDAAAT